MGSLTNCSGKPKDTELLYFSISCHRLGRLSNGRSVGKLIFDAEDVKKVYEHARASKHWRTDYRGDPMADSICLVHDQGVYLMSAGIPHLERPDKPESSFVAYAYSTHPEKDDEWWDNARELVGGDDFSEAIPLDSIAPLIERDDIVKLVIDITETHFTFAGRFAAKKKRTHRIAPELEDIT